MELTVFQAFWLGLNVARAESGREPALFGEANLLWLDALEDVAAKGLQQRS